MIVDKKSKQVISNNSESAVATENKQAEIQPIEKPVQVEANGPTDVLKSIMAILQEVTWEYGVPNSPKIFKTVQYDTGQYERIVRKNGNTEETISFPAAFVHFIDVNWITSAQRFNDGRAVLRIRFMLNRLDVHNKEHETDVYYVAERIHQTITELKGNYECLTKRCNLTYVDPMESFDNGLQPCWLTYDIWFTTVNIWVTRKKVMRKVVFPPFANHADQDKSAADYNKEHTNLSHPTTYDESTKFCK